MRLSLLVKLLIACCVQIDSNIKTNTINCAHARRLTHTHTHTHVCAHARTHRGCVSIFFCIAKCHCVWFYHPLANKYFCCHQHQMIIYLMQLENFGCIECNHQWCGSWNWIKQVATSNLCHLPGDIIEVMSDIQRTDCNILLTSLHWPAGNCRC